MVGEIDVTYLYLFSNSILYVGPQYNRIFHKEFTWK